MKDFVLMKIAAWRVKLLAAKMNAQGLKKETWEEICHAEQELNTLEAKIRGAESLQEISAALKETSFVKEGN